MICEIKKYSKNILYNGSIFLEIQLRQPEKYDYFDQFQKWTSAISYYPTVLLELSG